MSLSSAVSGYSFYLNVVVMNNGNSAQSLPEEEKDPESKKSSDNGKKLDSKAILNSMGKSISHSVHGINKRASAYVAGKTMVTRATIAVNEAIPEITEEIGIDISMSKRFQQGPVIVLEVDIKGCDMATLIEITHGDEASLHYKSVKDGMDFLRAIDSKKSFDAEILPKVRKDLMKKLEVLLSNKIISSTKGTGLLDVQCIALEDQEEAKWLYNFLEFMQQMK